MPEGHTIHRLAHDLNNAFAPAPVRVSSPQGRFAAGAELLNGREFLGAEAWGKHLFAEFTGERWLNVHLGLIGYFSVLPREAGEEIWGQVRLRIENPGWVADLRGPYICDVLTPEEINAIEARLGPDPLRADAEEQQAWERIQRSNKTIAELLLDQKVLAGVGNVYRAEVLWRHRLSPFTPGKKVKRASWLTIWNDLVRLMPLGVATNRIVTIEEEVQEVEARLAAGEEVDLERRDSAVYKQNGNPCPRCGSKIRTQVLAGRNLFWCGRCQRRM